MALRSQVIGEKLRNDPIITSLLDTDLYKFTMQQNFLHHYPSATAKYEFKIRNFPRGYLDHYKELIDEQLDRLCKLRFIEDGLAYLSTKSWFKPDYIEFLRLFQLNRKYIRTWICDKDEVAYKRGDFRITMEGPLVHVSPFEVYVLAIVSEIISTYTVKKGKVVRRNDMDSYLNEGRKRLNDKIEYIIDNSRCTYGLEPSEQADCGAHDDIDNACGLPCPELIKIIEFGTRRRYTKAWQDEVIKTMVKKMSKNFIGTSNVYYAKKYGVKVIGTMAHEDVQVAQGLPDVRLSESQKHAFDTWAQEYRGELGIALSDTLGMDAFFRDFDMYFAKLFDGCRHDSGDPYVWCDKLIDHYKSMNIDPRTKTAVFSDGLNFETAMSLHNKYKGKIKTSFGIGTYLTNDTGFKAPQIVIKNIECNGHPTAKISDSKGKMMCNDADYLKYLASVFKIKMIWDV